MLYLVSLARLQADLRLARDIGNALSALPSLYEPVLVFPVRQRPLTRPSSSVIR